MRSRRPFGALGTPPSRRQSGRRPAAHPSAGAGRLRISRRGRRSSDACRRRYVQKPLSPKEFPGSRFSPFRGASAPAQEEKMRKLTLSKIVLLILIVLWSGNAIAATVRPSVAAAPEWRITARDNDGLERVLARLK